MSKPQPQSQQPQGAAPAAPSPQQAGQAQPSHQLAHALQQHAQARGWNLGHIDWSAVGAAVNQLLEALLRGGGQPQPPTPAP